MTVSRMGSHHMGIAVNNYSSLFKRCIMIFVTIWECWFMWLGLLQQARLFSGQRLCTGDESIEAIPPATYGSGDEEEFQQPLWNYKSCGTVKEYKWNAWFLLLTRVSQIAFSLTHKKHDKNIERYFQECLCPARMYSWSDAGKWWCKGWIQNLLSVVLHCHQW